MNFEVKDHRDVEIERQILTAMIVDKKFLDRVAFVAQPELFDIEGAGTVCGWVLEYYNKYNKAPGHDIASMFRKGSRKMSEAETSIIQRFLSTLNDDYEQGSYGNINALFDDSCAYFKKQSLYKRCDKVMELIENDRVEEAEGLWAQSMLSISSDTDYGLDPFDSDSILNLTNPEFRFQTELGIPELDRKVGPIRSEWLVMWMGPMKRGKTQVLSHVALQNVLKGFNVLFISLESGYGDVAERFWMNVGSLRSRKDKAKIMFPYFGKRKKVLYKERRRPYMDKDTVSTVAKKFRRQRNGILWIKTFPAFSAGVREIKNYLGVLEAVERLTFHIIVIDYLGAMKPPAKVTGRDIYDHNSKELKALSQDRKAIVISAHQGNRKTLDKMNMSSTDIPEDVRILANVDVLLGLNQTEKEKEEGVMRLNVLLHRFRRFNRLKQVEILQALEAGQFYLDGRAIDAPKPRKDKLKNIKEDEEEDYTED